MWLLDVYFIIGGVICIEGSLATACVCKNKKIPWLYGSQYLKGRNPHLLIENKVGFKMPAFY